MVKSLHDMTHSPVSDGEDGLQMWEVAANIAKKQCIAADKGWSLKLEPGRGANNSYRIKPAWLHIVIGLDGFFFFKI